MTAELKGIHAKTFQDLDVIKDVLKLDVEKIAELEKENAELQQKWLNESYEKAKLVEKWKRNGECIIQECKDIEGANAYYKHQLTKAKALLTRFIRKGNGAVAPSWEELIAEAEHFLNSEVEK